MKTILLLVILGMACFPGCKPGLRSQRQPDHDTAGRGGQPATHRRAAGQAISFDTLRAGDLRLVPFSSTAFDDAELALEYPTPNAPLPDGDVSFKFKVGNFELRQQTADAPRLNCANSADGQHIHYIIDNEPYVALYNPAHRDTLGNGNHVLLAFLARSFHESVKGPKAFVLGQFRVGGQGTPADLEAPHMFYSRPKGTYKGKDTQNILLDFYLANTSLSEDGNRVRVTIDGTKTALITRWQPYFIQGMGMGQHSIKLELLDARNQPIAGPYNVVERTITLQQG